MPFPNISSVILKLGELLVQEGIYLYGTDDKIKWVNTELTRIWFFLGDAELKWKNGDAAVMNWVKELTYVGYEIEDFIDLIKYKNEIRRRRKGFIGSISRYAHLPGEIIALHKVGAKIEKIKAKLEEISKGIERYGIISSGNRGNEESGGCGGDDMINIERFHSPHFVDDMDVDGKGGLRRSEGESSSSISIKKINEMGELELKREIFEFLQGRKYLVVLDDVWGIDDWEKIRHIFPDNNNGSKILLTTRNMEVAEHADPRSAPLELQVLSDVESWELLRRKIFPRNHEVKIQSLMYVYLPCFSEEVLRNEITQNLHKLYMGFTLVDHRIKWLMLLKILQQQNKLVSLTIDVDKGLLEMDKTDIAKLHSYQLLICR
ncbi:putative disease resistance RPP13-like protein 3 [Carex littledalei]|uniref:Putative disease resistance RPP13-like protein 3 n=1 Tax=Carex littledalei TaxID=544730 RepID=A0A833RBE3_9POAL|nr:putative disease resistance RPP13-like protein 3 [Carex littledalei]